MENNSSYKTPSEMEYLYNHYKIGDQLRQIKCPYNGIDFAVKNMKEYLAIIVKEEQVMNLNSEQQVSVMEWLQKLRTIVESYGIRCELIGRKYVG